MRLILPAAAVSFRGAKSHALSVLQQLRSDDCVSPTDYEIPTMNSAAHSEIGRPLTDEGPGHEIGSTALLPK
jgi:hypothetical protein